MKINKGLLNIGENLEELKDPQYIIISLKLMGKFLKVEE